MAESASNRKVRTNKKGQKVVTKTRADGSTITRKFKKGEDGKRVKVGTSSTRTTEKGGTVKKTTNAAGRKKVTRTKEDGRSTSRTTGGKGRVQSISRTNKKGDTTTQKKGSAAVRTANKLKKATAEGKGVGSRIKKLQDRRKAAKAGGKSTAGLQKKINTAKKNMKTKVQKRMDKKK